MLVVFYMFLLRHFGFEVPRFMVLCELIGRLGVTSCWFHNVKAWMVVV